MAGQFHVNQSHDEDEEFRSRNGCFGFLFFHSGNLRGRTGYRSLLHEDGTAKVSCWEGGCKRAEKLFSQSIGRLRWTELAKKQQGRRLRGNNNITKKRKTGFNYDSQSYWLNFDDRDATDWIPRAADASAYLNTQR